MDDLKTRRWSRIPWSAAIGMTFLLLAGCRFLPPGLGDSDPTAKSNATDANGSAAGAASNTITGDSEAPVQSTSVQSTAAVAVLERADWVHRVRLGEDARGRRQPRWRHAAIEDLLSRPVAARPRFARFLDHASPVVAGNAAIALARTGSVTDSNSQKLVERLGDTVRHPQLGLPLRQAAAEALGEVESSVATSQLKSLTEQYGDVPGRAEKTPLPDLHAELIGSLIRQGLDEADPLLVEALQSPASQVLLTTLRAWPRQARCRLPQEVLDLAGDNRPEVRAAAIDLIAARRASEALEIIERALDDHYAQVRLAAVAGLGQLGDAKQDEGGTIELLEQVLQRDDVKMRAAAATALAALGARRRVVARATDDAWQVRRAVAAALSEDTSRPAVAAARMLLYDKSSQVAQQMVSTLEKWPLPKSGPVLLDALESPSFTVRKTAASVLSRQWSAAARFRAAGDLAERKEQLDELHRQWQADFEDVFVEHPPATAVAAKGPDSEAVLRQVHVRLKRLLDSSAPAAATSETSADRQKQLAALIEVGPSLVAALDAIVEASGVELPEEIFHKVLPQVDPMFELLVQFESNEVRLRRLAAQKLADEHTNRPFSRLALMRLVALTTTEADTLVWQAVQQALVDDVREPAIRLHYAGLSHPTADVRQRACELLAAHGDPQHQAALVAALGDQDANVVRAAAHALAVCGPMENPLPLDRLLASRDASTRLATGRTLSMLGFEHGAAALERLAHDMDFNVRRRAAEAMGETGAMGEMWVTGEAGRPSFTQALLSLLDDRFGVRRAALQSLAQINGQDFATDSRGQAVSLDRQTIAWRSWYDQQSRATPADHEQQADGGGTPR